MIEVPLSMYMYTGKATTSHPLNAPFENKIQRTMSMHSISIRIEMIVCLKH